MKLCGFEIGLDKPFFLMAGPCVIESEEMVMEIAREMKAICDELGIHYIFKASYDKANRTSVSSFRGPGLEKGLEILARVRETVGVPVVTDVHTEMEETRYGVNTAVDTVVADLGIDARITGDRAYVVDAHVDAQRTVLHSDEAADALGQRVTQRDVLQTQVVALFEEDVRNLEVVAVHVVTEAESRIFAGHGFEIPCVVNIGC